MTAYLYDIVAVKEEHKGKRLGPFSEADALRSAEEMNWVAQDHVVEIAISLDNEPDLCNCA